MPTIVPPTKTESVFRSLGYFLLGCAGVWILIHPPIIDGYLGLLTYAWGSSLIAAFIASVASYKRRYRIEYMALPLTIIGVMIYAFTIWVIVPEFPHRGPQALMLTAIFCTLVVRITTLHRLVVSWKGKPWIGSLQ